MLEGERLKPIVFSDLDFCIKMQKCKWDLRSKIGVQQLPLFKFLLSGDMKIGIFISTRLKGLKYRIHNFWP